ncbi:MAG: serine--tRNA ligase [Acidobacteria bacterium]|nr:serine--tRNA ligase [Acidobacteriota bacterium]
MLDLKLIRQDPEGVRAAVRRRGSELPVEEVLGLDRRRREAQARLDELRAEQKRASKEVPRLEGEERSAALGRLKDLSDEISALEGEQERLAAGLRELLLAIPNVPHSSVPEGLTEDHNVVVRTWGEPAAIEGEARDHLDIGAALDLIDVERAARASGSRFGYLKREAALLEFALVRFVLDRLGRHGFVPVVPPALVRREILEGTGALMAGEQQIYRTADDDLYLIGTSEVALAALHAGEVLDAAALPVRYAGFSTCFRREAGTHGKDTRGIFRVHQFDKVEMFSYCHPDGSWEEHELMLAREEEILQALEIPYRVVALCAGDLYGPSAKSYDLEAWFPGQGRYRETTSCSNCTDYQARRLNVRFRGEGGARLVHMLNGTAVAVGRTLAAILENHQRADGSVSVPEALRPYAGFDRIGPR